MVWTSALQAPSRQQWELSSLWSQAWNCGMASAAFIAGFMKDNRPGIEEGRRLIASMGPYGVTGIGTVWGSPSQTPTTAWQQRDVLIKRGVPAGVRIVSDLATLHGLVDSSRRPIIVGILMGRVSWQVRGHTFTGMHAVVIICGGYKNGIRGFWIMDPNFPAGSSESIRFYSDAMMQWAYVQYPNHAAVVPTNAKAVAAPAPSTIKAGGLPVTFTSRTGWKASIAAGKPRRAGATTTATNYGVSASAEAFPIWGEVVGEDLSQYGLSGGKRWLFGPQYIKGKGWRVVYIPIRDLINRKGF